MSRAPGRAAVGAPSGAGSSEPLLAAVLIGVLSWAALSPLTFARASGLPGLARFADDRYGGYFALMWPRMSRSYGSCGTILKASGSPCGKGSSEPASPVAIGLFWRWERGGGRDASGEYVVRWYRYDARVNQWSLWHVEPGRVDRVDPQEGLIYRRGLIVESGAGELDGRWRVTSRSMAASSTTGSFGCRRPSNDGEVSAVSEIVYLNGKFVPTKRRWCRWKTGATSLPTACTR